MTVHYKSESTGNAYCGLYSLAMLYSDDIEQVTCKRCEKIVKDKSFPGLKRTESLFKTKAKCKKYKKKPKKIKYNY